MTASLVELIEQHSGVSNLDSFLAAHLKSYEEDDQNLKLQQIVDGLQDSIQRSVYLPILETVPLVDADQFRDLSFVLGTLPGYAQHLGNKLRDDKTRIFVEGEDAIVIPDYWKSFTSILVEWVGARQAEAEVPEKVQRTIDRLSAFSTTEMLQLSREFVYTSKGEIDEGNLDFLLDSLSARTFDKEEVMTQAFKVEYETLKKYFARTDPRIIDFDPKLSKLRRSYQRFTSKEISELFDFRDQPLTKDEYTAICNLIPKVGTKRAAQHLLELKREADTLLTSVTVSEAATRAIGFPITARDDAPELTFFEYANDLWNRHKKHHKEFYSDEAKVAPFVFPLYFLHRSGIITSKEFSEVVKQGTNRSSGLGKYFWDAAVDYAFLTKTKDGIDSTILNIIGLGSKPFHNLGTLDPGLVSLGVGEDIATQARNLAKAKAQYPNFDHVMKILNKIKIDIEYEDPSEYQRKVIFPVLEKTKNDPGLEALLTSTDGTVRIIQGLYNAWADKTGTRDIKTFIDHTAQFHAMLAGSCDLAQIVEEYHTLLDQVPKNQEKKALDILDPMGDQVQAVFKKYNAPADFEEQAEVASNLVAMVSGKQIPVVQGEDGNLFKELPYGGSNSIRLPRQANVFQAKMDNAWIYNLIAFLHAGMHKYGGYELDHTDLKSATGQDSLQDYFATFANPTLAESIFIAAEHSRLFSHLSKRYSGLPARISAYVETRKAAAEAGKVSFAHRSERMIFDAENAHYLDNEPLADVNLAPTLLASIKAVKTIYDSIEAACKKEKDPIPEEEQKDPRVLEELLKQRMENVIYVAPSSLTSPVHRYPEVAEGRTVITEVREQEVPTRPNPLVERFLAQRANEVQAMQQHLAQLAPPDVYIERRKMQGRLDRRAAQRYQRDIKAGRVPNPRIFARKVIERRDVTTVIALNLNRGINSKGDGESIPYRQAMQQLMAAFAYCTDQLGDKVGIYGYSGKGAENVKVFVYKEVDEPFTEEVNYRLAFVGGQNYNRNGAAYRHLTTKLNAVEAEEKFFVDIGAGFKPFDAEYDGQAAVKDTKAAVDAMKRAGIQPFCISLTEEGRDDMRTVFGRNHLVTSPSDIFKDMTEMYTKMSQG